MTKVLSAKKQPESGFNLIRLIRSHLLCFLFLTSLSSARDSDLTKISVYAKDLALIKEAKLIALQSGKNEIKIPDLSPKIDPLSIQIKSNTDPSDFILQEIITKPELIFVISSKQGETHRVGLSYLTEGMSWRAGYLGTLDKDEKKMNLKSWVTIENNTGTFYKDAMLTLVAGEARRIKGQYEDFAYQASFERRVVKTSVAKEPEFELLPTFDYYSYKLDRPIELLKGQTKQIEYYSATGIPVKKLYVYDGGKNAEIIIEGDNTKENKIGIPLPPGRFSVFKEDRGDVSFIGEDVFYATPIEEKFNLYVGDAFDILGERVVIASEQTDKGTYKGTIQIKLRNRKNEEVTVKVKETTKSSNWEMIKTTHTFTKQSANKIEFEVKILANDKSTVEYTIHYLE